jgi:CHAT domain-containing protein
VFALRGKTRLLPNVAVGTAAIASLYLSGCTRTSTIELPLQQVFAQQIDIPPGASASVSTKLDAGTYSIVVSELGVDVATNVTANGATVALNDLAPRHGVQIAVVTVPAGEPSVVSVQAQSTDHRTKKGSASVEIRRWPETLSKELRAALQGERAFMRALGMVGDSADWDKVASAFGEAAEEYANAEATGRAGLAHYSRALVSYEKQSNWSASEGGATEAIERFVDARSLAYSARARLLRAASWLEQANELASAQDASERKTILDRADMNLLECESEFGRLSLTLDATVASNLRGIAHWYARDFARSREFFARAASDARRDGDAATEANVLGNLAWLDYATGRTQESAEEYRRLLDVLEADRQPADYAAHAANYALVLATLGDFDRAAAIHNRVLAHATRAKDDVARTRQLVALGVLALQQGDSRRALEFARTALDLPSDLKDRAQYNSALRLAGNASQALGDYSQARRYFSQLLDRAVSPTDASRSRVLLAAASRSEGDFREAARQLDEGLKHGDSWVRAEGLLERARLRFAAGDHSKSVEDLRQADNLYQSLGIDAPRIAVGTLLSEVLLRSKDPQGARVAADAAIALVSQIRARSANPEVRARFLSSRYAPFEAKIAAILVSGSRDEQSSLRESLDTAETVRSQSLRELLTEASSRSQPAQQRSETTRWREALATQQMLLERRLQRTASSDKSVAELQRSIAEIRARLAASATLGLTSGAGAEQQASNPVTTKELQALIPRDTVVAYFFVGASRSELWLLTSSVISHKSLAGRETLEQAVSIFVRQQKEPDRQFVADQTLTDIGTALASAGPRQITVVPDGPLNGLPFAALPVVSTSSAQSPLVSQKVVSFAPSLAALARIHGSERRTKPGLVAIVSDPVYAADDSRLASVVPNHMQTQLRGPDSSEFLRLPFSGAEAREVARQFVNRERIEISGLAASAEAVSNLPFAELDVLHIATHARGREDDPSLSAVYLSAYTPRGAAASVSQITAGHILEAGMRARLVVLSGCGTAGGTPLAGEGILGLTHSFLANGSDAVVASLWAVEDAETARLMTDFYAAYRSVGEPAEALAIAQRKAIARSPQSRTWASFMVRRNGFGSERQMEEMK